MRLQLAIVLACMGIGATVHADPCGMVPPIHVDTNDPGIARVGAQRTYVMFDRGMETMVLRPGFEGTVDEFGMLIPFPTPPAVRKIDDDTFAQIEAAVDPPQLQVNIHKQQRTLFDFPSAMMGAKSSVVMREESVEEESLGYNEVRVLREEAVGMYQVAVIEAGSSAALKRWMAENEYRYPEGMDDIADEYVAIRWCFVAIKAHVGQAKGVAATPGMRSTNVKLPSGATFDGHVQGMGFRFQTEKAVIPMRLSVFNGEKPRNVIYMLTNEPTAVLGAPTNLVVRQVDGETLHANLTNPIPVVYPNENPSQLNNNQRESIAAARSPEPYNGIARDLFAADLLAARTGQLALAFEEDEKKLLNISESLGLRGDEIDALLHEAVQEEQSEAVAGALDDVREMSLTVLDGVLPHELVRDKNLVFRGYTMPETKNVARNDGIRPNAPAMTFWY